MTTQTAHISKELFPILPVSSIRLAPDNELQLCHSHPDAIRRTVDMSQRKRFAIEDEAGISASHLTQVFSGSKHLPSDDRVLLFYTACQNVYNMQWLLWRLGKRVIDRDFTEEERLRERNAYLETRLAEYERARA